jgi:FkbM family methyltransferase
MSKSEQALLVDIWNKDNGERLRYDYDLNEDSIVIDLGAYIGDFSKRIYNKYKCNVYAFEPVDEFYYICNLRFDGIDKVKYFNYGLGPKNETIEILLIGDESSSHINDNINGEIEYCNIRHFENFIENENIKSIDLMKINIEGDEFKLLHYLTNKGIISMIKNLQIQFHNFDHIYHAKQKRINIIKKLEKTHVSAYSYPCIWEGWKLKND